MTESPRAKIMKPITAYAVGSFDAGTGPIWDCDGRYVIYRFLQEARNHCRSKERVVKVRIVEMVKQ